MDDSIEAGGPTTGGDRVTWWVLGGVLAVMAVGAGVYLAARPPAPTLGDDPLLATGQALYMDRCVGCHGEKGRGDGPIAKGLVGPPPGDLTDGEWKHGDRPDQIAAVIRNGIEGTSMTGWGRWLEDDQLRGVTAYVLLLAGREIPAELRAAPGPESVEP